MKRSMNILPALCTCFLLAGIASAGNLTLTANAYLNADGELVSDDGGAVLLTADEGNGSLTNAFVFAIAGDFDLGGHTVRGRIANTDHQYSATWQVSGDVTGGGRFDSYTDTNDRSGGHVRIEANGSITIDRVYTRNTLSYGSYVGGDVYLWAKSGTVTLNGSIYTRGMQHAGSVTIRSEGPVSEQGIAILGTVDGIGSIPFSILAETRHGSVNGASAGKVALYCEGDITLAGGISTRVGDKTATTQDEAAHVWIRGSYEAPDARAGNVVVAGEGGIRTDSFGNNPPTGDIIVLARSLQVDGRLDTSSRTYFRLTGDVDINVLENAVVGGFIHTRFRGDWGASLRGAPGNVTIQARRIAVLGMDEDGYGIRTWVVRHSHNPWEQRWLGDRTRSGDVTLSGTETSMERYNEANPTNSATSSIVLDGGILTGRWYHNDASGDIRIAAVEVQLGGNLVSSPEVQHENQASSMAIHYGVPSYGIYHLVEDGVRWDGTSAHNIAYNIGLGTLSFAADVSYAGLVTPSGTLLLVR